MIFRLFFFCLKTNLWEAGKVLSESVCVVFSDQTRKDGRTTTAYTVVFLEISPGPEI